MTLDNVIRNACLSLLVIMISACGFSLRGSYQLPVQLQEIKFKQANNQFHKEIAKYLKSAKVIVSNKTGIPKLMVSQIEEARTILSVGSAGNPQEYELTATATVSIPETQNGIFLPPKKLIVRRDYVYESTGVLNANGQEIQLKIEMEKELARKVMQALQAVQ